MKHPLIFCKCVFPLIALALLFPVSSRAQKKSNFGKEFYVAFAENQGGQVGNDENQNFFALFITSRVATSGTVEVTALGFSQNFTTTPGQITTIELPDGKHFNDPTVELTFTNNQEETVVHGMAVHITSNDNIAVYGMNHKEYSSDAFMALPIGVLGTEYRTLCYNTSNPNGGFGGGGVTPGEFWIVGVEDSTNITITPKASTRQGVLAGTQIKQLLYKGDVYLLQGDPNDVSNDLTGSLIESDQPIAVLSGHVRTEIPNGVKNLNSGGQTSRDHLCEQLPPVSAWGDSALVVRYESATLPDLVRVVSSEDGNVLSVNGAVVKTLNAGDFYEIKALQGPTSIQATSPILVGQYMHTSQYGITGAQPPYGDPAYALIFPVEQFDTSYTFMLDQNPTFNGNFINIVADPAGITTMMLDGKSITGAPYNATFQPIPGSNYVYAQISFKISQQGAHDIYSTKPFGITAYALGPVDSYSYPAGTLLKTITPFKTVDVIIDFGDRVMTANGVAPNLYDTVKTKLGVNKWDTTVYLQNISSDPYTINGFTNRGGNGQTDFDVNRFPNTILPSAFDSVTIEFNTTQPYVELNTTIQALTPHLQAYVVQVKGRGILVNAEMYSDSNSTLPIDTLDFGVFDAAVDQAKDSFVYIANKGTTDLTIDTDNITGPNAADFTFSPPPFIPRTIKSKPVTPPFVLHPFSNTLALEDSSAKVMLRFSPKLLPNGFYQAEYDITTNGQSRKVILLAEVKTILKSSVTNIAFDTAFLCEQETRSIFVNNPNDFPITVTNLQLIGLDSLDFNPITQIPLVIPPNSQGEIQLTFSPNDTTGTRSAAATLSFDLPKGFTQTIPLSAYGDQLTNSFWARNNINILPGESTLFPIYARSPMEKFASTTVELDVWYDPTRLQDDPNNYVNANTLTANGYWTVNNDSIGYSVYTYISQPSGTIVSGGSDTEQMPLIYLSFKSLPMPADSASHFHQSYDINYRVIFPGSSINQGCILSLAPVGVITLDSTCRTVYLLLDTLLFPTDSYIEPIRPNPTSAHTKFIFDVPKDDNVRIDLIDMMGTQAATVLDEVRKPGTYEVDWDAAAVRPGMYIVRLITAGRVKTRQLVIMK